MVQESRFGLMEQNMKVNGETTKLTEKESSGMLTVMSTKVIGKKTKQTDSVFTLM